MPEPQRQQPSPRLPPERMSDAELKSEIRRRLAALGRIVNPRTINDVFSRFRAGQAAGELRDGEAAQQRLRDLGTALFFQTERSDIQQAAPAPAQPPLPAFQPPAAVQAASTAVAHPTPATISAAPPVPTTDTTSAARGAARGAAELGLGAVQAGATAFKGGIQAFTGDVVGAGRMLAPLVEGLVTTPVVAAKEAIEAALHKSEFSREERARRAVMFVGTVAAPLLGFMRAPKTAVAEPRWNAPVDLSDAIVRSTQDFVAEARTQLRTSLGREPSHAEVRTLVADAGPTIVARAARQMPANGVQDGAGLAIRPGAGVGEAQMPGLALHDLEGRPIPGTEITPEQAAAAEARKPGVPKPVERRVSQVPEQEIVFERRRTPAGLAQLSQDQARQAALDVERYRLQSLDAQVGTAPRPEALGIQTPNIQPAPSIEALVAQTKQAIAAEATQRGEVGAAGQFRWGKRPTTEVASPNPKIEAFFQQTGRPPQTSTALLDRVVLKAQNFFNQFNEVRPNALNKNPMFGPYFADFREALRQGVDGSRLTNANTTTLLHGVTRDLAPRDLELWSRVVVLRDLVNSAARGLRMPRGLNPADLTTELHRLERFVAAKPTVQVALERQGKMTKTVEQELVRRGVLARSTVEANPAYFHHQVLDYLESYYGSRGPKAIRRLYRGYKEKRLGGAQDIYTDALEVIYGHTARVLRDNLFDDIVAKAAAAYDVRVRPMPGRAEPLTEALAQGVGLSDETLSQHGYVRYNAGGPRLEQRSRTMAEAMAMRVYEAIMGDADIARAAGLEPAHVRNMMNVLGGKTYIIPKEAASVLSNFRAQFTTQPSGMLVDAVRTWKQLVLNVAPMRYNRNNFLSDLERTWAAMPDAVKLLPRVIRDQLANLRGTGETEKFTLPDGREVSRYELAQQRSVTSSGRTATEVGRVKKLEEFARFMNRPALRAAARPLHTISGYLRRVSQVREDWLRLATFYRNLDAIRDGTKLHYGISRKDWVDAITDPVDRAAKISRETLGDYGGATAAENRLRNGAIPFYMWMKINSSFWPLLVMRQGAHAFARGAPISAARTAAWTLSRVSMVYAMAWTWNNLVHPEQEADLPEMIRNRLHFNTGSKDAQGRWVTATEYTALDDFLQTLGLDGASTDLRQFFHGQLTLPELLQRTGVSVAKGPAEAVANRFGPELTLPFALGGKSTYPSIFALRDVPPQQAVGNVLGQLGLPRGVSDLAYGLYYGLNNDLLQQAATPSLPTLVNTVVPAPFGLAQTTPPEEEPLVQEKAALANEVDAYIRELERQQNNIAAGLSMRSRSEADRTYALAVLDAMLTKQYDRLQRLTEQESTQRQRAQRRRNQ